MKEFNVNLDIGEFMEYVDKTQKIKKALLQGGLVISERNTGKTRALAEILLEDPNAIVVWAQQSQKDRLVGFLLEANCTQEDINKKLILAPKANRLFMNGTGNKNIYVDEYVLSDYTGPFKAAVTSFPVPVSVVT